MKSTRFPMMFALGLGLAGTSSSMQIEPPADAPRALAEAKSLKCEFGWYSSANWDSDQPKAKAGVQEFTFHIDGLDRKERRARLIGNAGAEDLVMVIGDSSISLIERVPVGAVNLTTVYAWPDKRGRFKSVHSRHTAIGGPSPSQNYGYCQSW